MTPLELQSYAIELPATLAEQGSLLPWDATANAAAIVAHALEALGTGFVRVGNAAIHTSADVHPSAVITEPTIIDADAVVGPSARLRGGVFLGRGCSVGPSVEVKSSFVFEQTALAHLNYVGNSVVGHDTNIEAGAVLANHFNERDNKAISVLIDDVVHETGHVKFGAAVGPRSRIGANAVTTPGTYLHASSIVARLELVDQLADRSDWRGRSQW